MTKKEARDKLRRIMGHILDIRAQVDPNREVDEYCAMVDAGATVGRLIGLVGRRTGGPQAEEEGIDGIAWG